MKECKVSFCHRTILAKGLCQGHYRQKREGKKFTPVRYKAKNYTQPRQCKFDGCERPYKAGGYCKQHYDMYIHSGRDTTKLKPIRPISDTRESDMELFQSIMVEWKMIRDRDADVYQHCEMITKRKREEMYEQGQKLINGGKL